MSVRRIMGSETEFGILDLDRPQTNPIQLSGFLVHSYCDPKRTQSSITWDYVGEDPLQDLRGFRLRRENADPSQLTDRPDQLAPSGPRQVEESIAMVARPSTPNQAETVVTSRVLSNGARFYVDHAHPEYASPEVIGPKDAALYDAAGDLIAQAALIKCQEKRPRLSLYKNNTDGKGAAYGAHENYLLKREVPFSQVISALTSFFVTRPVYCGAGRLGIGQSGQAPGFQISQRADFIEELVGLQTTYRRPLINSRDEAHADYSTWRRLHVICGDANLYPISTYLRFGATAVVLSLIELGAEHHLVKQLVDLELIEDPVLAIRKVSHDPQLKLKLETKSGRLSAVEIQLGYCHLAKKAALEIAGSSGLDSQTQDFFNTWEQVLEKLQTDPESLSGSVEWIGKYLMLCQLKERIAAPTWDHPKLLAFDLQWHDLHPTQGIQTALRKTGFVKDLNSPTAIELASKQGPHLTRGGLRGEAVTRFEQLQKASWSSLLFDLGETELYRVTLLDPQAGITGEQRAALTSGNVKQFIETFRE